jgi:hypothetical protein
MKKTQSFKDRYGPWALVTGAASGIGAEFGRQLAAEGFNLVLVDIQADILHDYTRGLKSRRGIEIRPVVADLSRPDFIDKIRKSTRGLTIGLLVNNAGYGTAGEFMNTDLTEMIDTLAVNCRAPLVLTHEFGRSMIKRRRGGIIFISSTSALQGTAIVANYAATKAYNLILGEALWDELRSYDVDVLAFCPGATNTPAFEKSGARIDAVPGMPFMEPEPVVAEALAALGKVPRAIAGRDNRVIAFIMTRLLTRRKLITLYGKNTRLLFPVIKRLV